MERTSQNREMNITFIDAVPALFGNIYGAGTGNSFMLFFQNLTITNVFGKSVVIVRSVVREEVQRLRPEQNAPMLSSLADVVREEVSQAVRDACFYLRPSPVLDRWRRHAPLARTMFLGGFFRRGRLNAII